MALFSSQEYIFVLDMILALAAGILIGLERESRGKPGGINTQSFVIGGAAIFTFISRTMLPNTPRRNSSRYSYRHWFSRCWHNSERQRRHGK